MTWLEETVKMDKRVNHLGFIGKHHPLSCGRLVKREWRGGWWGRGARGKKSHGSGLRQQGDIIKLMQHGGDVVWWDGGGVNTGVSDLGSASLKPSMHGYLRECTHVHWHTQTCAHTALLLRTNESTEQWEEEEEDEEASLPGGCLLALLISLAPQLALQYLTFSI